MKAIKKFFCAVICGVIILPAANASVKHKVKSASAPKAPIADVFFSNDWKSISTFDSTYVQNRNVPKVRGVMHLVLTEAEQQRIAALADSVNFWNIPLYLVGDRNAVPNPGKQTLRVKTSKADRTIMWAGVLMDGKTAVPINKIKTLLNSIVESRPDYKKLPASIMKGYEEFTPAPINAPVPLSPQ